MIPRLAALALTATAAACTAVGPDYTAPNAALPTRYAEGTGGPTGNITQDQWWRGLNDATLNALVARGLAQNLTVAAAVERVAQSQATVRQTGAAALASGGLSAGVTQSGGDGSSTRSESATASPTVLLDLFGAERRSREAALARLEATRLDLGTARLAFLSSLVTGYIDARYYQAALAITRRTISSRQETLDLVRQQRAAGTATELDLAQAEALLASTRATLPSLEASFLSSVYGIATLLAEPAQPLVAQLQRGAPQPRPSGSASAGVPADLLRNRPDVASAERSYAAAVADVGVAEADLYPSLSLTGSIRAADGGTSWSFGPSLSLPVLSQPRVRAARDSAISAAKQAELTWRGTVLSAVEDVQSAQSTYLRARQTVSATATAADSYRRVVDLARQTYDIGTVTLLDLLDSQRSLASEELTLASAVRSMASSWAALQVASGKGWAVSP